MYRFLKIAKSRPILIALGAGGIMALIWLISFTALTYAPRIFLALLVGTFTSFLAYSKQQSPSQDSFRVAAFLAAGISLICMVGLLLAIVR